MRTCFTDDYQHQTGHRLGAIIFGATLPLSKYAPASLINGHITGVQNRHAPRQEERETLLARRSVSIFRQA